MEKLRIERIIIGGKISDRYNVFRGGDGKTGGAYAGQVGFINGKLNWFGAPNRYGIKNSQVERLIEILTNPKKHTLADECHEISEKIGAKKTASILLDHSVFDYFDGEIPNFATTEFYSYIPSKDLKKIVEELKKAI